MLKVFILFLFIINSLYSFPISMKKNWKVALDKNLNYEANSPAWQDIQELTFRPTQVKNLPVDRNILVFTLYKSFLLTKADLEHIDRDVSIFFPFISNVFEFYLNGQKIYAEGKISENTIEEYGVISGYVQILPRKYLLEGENHIYIVVGGYSNEEIAVYGSDSVEINFYENHLKLISETVDFILLSLYVFTGLYHLLLFVKRPKEKYNLYFALFGIFIGSYLFFRTYYIFKLNLDYLLQYKLELILLFATASFMLMFFENFLQGSFPKLIIGYNVFLSILGFIVIIGDRVLATKALQMFQVTGFLLLAYISYLMIKAVLAKHADAKSLSFGFLILLFTIILDLIGAMHVIPNFENPNLTRYGFFTFIMGIAVVLANRFLRVHREVEELNATLEKKVEERTKELAESLDKVQKLKTQQDGDYFLTSLLIKPLMRNEAKSEKVKVEFYIKQKKSFEFKNKKYEIGGDICIANDIYIRDKKYIAFVNGDAMGKSIQGAGGALVLGVVFRSVITRTQMKKENQYPEKWLKSCFIELQNIFVSFDGSMLISVVLGLVEEKNGMFFFINAEHPWVVLYRDATAKFIENSLSLRKIGMTGLYGVLRVQTFQMQPEDVLIVGSDGRDDILLNYSQSGERVINEDETLFLKNVERGKGDLSQIAKCIQEVGELTDDFTLVKISYKPNGEIETYDYYDEEKFFDLKTKANQLIEQKEFQKALHLLEEAYQIKPKDKDLLKSLIHVCFALHKYEITLEYSNIYLELEPIDNEYMFIQSACLKLLNQLELAIDVGEALKLREPQNVKNLINLADSYRLAKNYSRAEKILNYALEKEPNNPKAIKLKQILEHNLS